jgi:integrase/recombinase XerD
LVLEFELADYLSHLTVERGLSANTIAAYRRDLARYCEFLVSADREDLASVTADTISEFLQTVRNGHDGRTPLTAASTARMLASVRGWHRYLASELEPGVAADALSDPTLGLTPPSLGIRLPHALSIDQVQRLLKAAATGDPPSSLQNRALLELLYASGARVSEVVALDVDAAQWDPLSELSMITVLGKGNKERLVPVGEFARIAIDDYIVGARPSQLARGSGTHALFVNNRGGRLSRQTAWEIIQKVAARAEIETHVSPHTLRHSFATHLLSGGADVRVVQELLGHASVTTTQIYTMVTRDTLREVYLTSHPRAL